MPSSVVGGRRNEDVDSSTHEKANSGEILNGGDSVPGREEEEEEEEVEETAGVHDRKEGKETADLEEKPLDSTMSSELSYALSDDESEEEEDSDIQELYQPSSPFNVQEDFILPDIMEESEEGELESLAGACEDEYSRRSDQNFNLAEGDFKETNFDEEESLPDNTSPRELSLASNPPILPTSPPPGPLLSPQALMELKGPPPSSSYQHHHPTSSSSVERYRHSVAGGLEDIPPPLPTTEPPGKPISPRHSMFMDLADLSKQLYKLDTSQVVSKMTNHCTARDSESTAALVTEKQQTAEEQREAAVSGAEEEDLSLLPPPLGRDSVYLDEEDSTLTRERLGSHHRKTFEPPKEFSDSGFHTDNNHIVSAADQKMTHQRTGSPRNTVLPPRATVSDGEEKDNPPPRIWVQKADTTSTTCTSDEQLTENSGSVGLKTYASSGSEVRTLFLANVYTSDAKMKKKVPY